MACSDINPDSPMLHRSIFLKLPESVLYVSFPKHCSDQMSRMASNYILILLFFLLENNIKKSISVNCL